MGGLPEPRRAGQTPGSYSCRDGEPDTGWLVGFYGAILATALVNDYTVMRLSPHTAGDRRIYTTHRADPDRVVTRSG